MMQGDTGGYGGAAQAPTRAVPIYQVWTDDMDVDEWAYDPSEALLIYQFAMVERRGPVHITKYEETDGEVNLRDSFTRLTLEELEDDARHHEPSERR